MKEIIIRWTENIVLEIEDEETGEVQKEYKREQHHERFNLLDILEMTTSWGKITITFIDGTVYETKDDESQIYFR